MAVLPTADLSEATLAGTGIFDVLMRAAKVHLEAEFGKGRIKGAEYATVYLGAMNLAMQSSVQYALQKRTSDQQALLLAEQLSTQVQQTALVTRQALNAVIEGEVLTAQKCKLQAEFDLTMANVLKSGVENSLLSQKVLTEKAQVTALGVDTDSVVGRQKALFLAQSDGYKRDAEQKAAKLLVDTWSVRKTTDELTPNNMENKLHDSFVGQSVGKLLSGVGL